MPTLATPIRETMTTITIGTLRERLATLDRSALQLPSPSADAATEPDTACGSRREAAGIRLVLPELRHTLDALMEVRDYIADGEYDRAYDRAEGVLELHGIACAPDGWERCD
ncbi:MAG: hypothetical protein QM755_02620 [Luteolibacter sp.]